jgi:hypothetical protein
MLWESVGFSGYEAGILFITHDRARYVLFDITRNISRESLETAVIMDSRLVNIVLGKFHRM